MTLTRLPRDDSPLPDFSISDAEIDETDQWLPDSMHKGWHRARQFVLERWYGALPPLPELQYIQVERAWNEAKGQGITIAVIDTGCYEHRNLKGRVLGRGKSFIPGRDPSDTNDTNGHGTAVAGLIAADSGYGVAPLAKILPLKVFDTAQRDITTVMRSTVEALEWLIDNPNGVSVVNISLGDGGNYSDLSSLSPNSGVLMGRFIEVTENLRNERIPVIAAAGNYYKSKNGMCFPAILPNVISVGAVHWETVLIKKVYHEFRDTETGESPTTFRFNSDTIAPFSQRLAKKDENTDDIFTKITAPGANIETLTLNDYEFRRRNGTSLAVPLVTGVIALMQELHKRRFLGRLPTCSNIERWLTEGATSIDDKPTGDVNVTNSGKKFHRLDALGALNLVTDPEASLS